MKEEENPRGQHIFYFDKKTEDAIAALNRQRALAD